MLGLGVVHGDDRVAEPALRLERLEADDAGGGLLGPPDQLGELLLPLAMEDTDHIGAVVHRHLRVAIDGSVDVPIVGVVVLAIDRVDLGVVAIHEGRGNVVLGGQGVRGAERHLGATGREGPDEIRGLGCDVQATRHDGPVERALTREPFADLGQHRHLPIRPLDASLPVVRQGDIGDVVALLSGCQINPSVGMRWEG